MLKVRYFRIRLATTRTFEDLLSAASSDVQSPALQLERANSAELILRFTTTRHIKTVQYLADGSSVVGTAMTMDQHAVRIFRDATTIFLSLVEPGRGSQVINYLLDRLLGPANYFIDSLELDRNALQSYVQRFQSFKLVAAKIRDFQAYEKAIARLEISGKEGIADDIAPFVAGKFFRIDSLTYEVIHDFQKGLVTYFANGTLRVTQSLVQIAFPIFEDHLRSGK